MSSTGVPRTVVRWDDVRRFRLARQQLSERARRSDLGRVLGRVGGVQAQLASAAQIGLWTRVNGVERAELEDRLAGGRSLARAWCMRRTLHLLPARDLSVYVRGTALRAEKEVRWVRNRGVPADTVERLLATTLNALEVPRTRSEIAAEVGRALRVPQRSVPGAGWGNRSPVPGVHIDGLTLPVVYLLHLVGARGVVCHGPPRDVEPTFVRADAWLRPFHDVSSREAETDLLRRYLGAFGPATVDDYAAWTGLRRRDAARIWSEVDPELAAVDVEGWKSWALRKDVEELRTPTDEEGPVRLLPYFDSFLLGHRDRQHLMEERNLRHVYRPQGWIAPTVLVDGRVVGVWNLERSDRTLRLDVVPFVGAERTLRDRTRRDALDAEASRLASFLGSATAETTVSPPRGRPVASPARPPGRTGATAP